MTEQEIESRILVCEMREQGYLEVGNTKTAERYSNEKYKWEKLLSRLDSKRDKELADYKKGYNNLEHTLNKIKTYCNNKIKNSLESEFDDTKRKDRLFTETIIELQCIIQIIDGYYSYTIQI